MLVFILAIISLSTTFFFAIWSKEIFSILIKNDQLKQIYPLAIILVMSANHRPFYIGAVQKIAFIEKTNLLWRISGIAGVLNIIFNILLIPHFGFHAAAYSTFGCTMFLGFGWYFFSRTKDEIIGEYYPILWLLFIILLTGVGLILVEADFLYKLVTSVILIIVSIFSILKLSGRVI